MRRALVPPELALRALVLPALLAGAAAQTEPLLRLVAGESGIAHEVGALFDPDLRGDPQARGLVLDAAGTARLVAGTLAAGCVLDLELRPAALLQRAAPTAAAERSAGNRLDALLQAAGLPRGAGAALLGEALVLLRQVERIALSVQRLPRGGRRIDLLVSPRQGSALERWIRLAVPAPQRPLPALHDPVLALQAAVDPAHARALLLPFLELRAALAGAASDEARADFEQALRCLDGSFGFALGRDRSVLVIGLVDPVAYDALQNAPAALDRAREHLARQRRDGDYTTAAFAHRGIAVLRSAVVGSLPTGLENERGEVESFGATVGDLWLCCAGREAREFMRATLDGALDAGMLRRCAAADKTPLLSLEARLDHLLALQPLAQAAGPALAESVPRRLQLTVFPIDSSLKAEIRLQ